MADFLGNTGPLSNYTASLLGLGGGTDQPPVQGPTAPPPVQGPPAPVGTGASTVASLQGSQTSPQTGGTVAPFGTAQSGATTGTSAVKPFTPGASGPVDLTTSNQGPLGQAMMAIQTQVTNSNKLVDQKNLMLKAMYGGGLTDAEKAQLDPGLASAISSGDRNLIDFNLRLLNDQIAGRTNTLDTSINYLSNQYNTQVQDAETRKQDAINNFVKFAQQFPNPGDAAKALAAWYSPDQLAQLGLNYPELSNLNLTTTSGVTHGTTVTGVSSLGSLLGYYTQGDSNTTPGTGYTGAVLNALKGTGLDLNSTPDQLMPYTSQIAQGIANGENISPGLLAATNNPGAIEWATAQSYGLDSSYGATPYKDTGNGITYAKFPDQTTGMDALNSLVGDYLQGGGQTPASAAPPDPTDPQSNTPDPTTQISPNGMYQAAMDWAFAGKMIPTGIGSTPIPRKIRADVVNKGAAIASSMGSNFPAMQALYKANSAAATQNVERLARVESVNNALTLNIPRLMTLADQVNASGVPIQESDLQATSADIQRRFGGTPAAAYIELLQTLRSDYSAAQSALAGSRGGQYFAQNAADAIPIGLSSDQYKTIGDTINQSSQNAATAINGEVQNLISGGTGQTGASGSGNPSGPAYNSSSDILKSYGLQ